MVKSMFAAIAGLRSHQSKMDVISNNVANVNTWGYKSKSANFQDALYQNVISSTGGNEAAGASGGVNASQLGYGSNLGSISTNHTQGGRAYTGSGSNCMINGTGFFIVGPMIDTSTTAIANNALEGTGLALSRVGIFSVDDNGYLVDDTGNYVYGYRPTDELNAETMVTTGLHAIQIPYETDPDTSTTPPTPGVRYTIQQIKIGQDGVILGIDDSNKTIVIGQIALASVENPNGLEQTSGYLFEIGGNAGQVEALEATGALGQILSGYLEQSNVDLATDMADMITTQRGYQANTKIITVTDEMLEQLVNMKR